MLLDPESLFRAHRLERQVRQAPARPTVRRPWLLFVPRPMRAFVVAALRDAYVSARAVHVASNLPA